MHSLYQDLFLTDIKRDVQLAQSELKDCKVEQNSVFLEHQAVKKLNQNLKAQLKRHRQELQGLTAGRSPIKRRKPSPDQRRNDPSRLSNEQQ
jgi:hypothetical protein